MLTAEDNELLCRIGPGTPMGNMIRQYWLPALGSDELPEPDCPPVRTLLMGEKLIAFRGTDGKIGLIADKCPHRGTSLFFGRSDEHLGITGQMIIQLADDGYLPSGNSWKTAQSLQELTSQSYTTSAAVRSSCPRT